MVWKRRILRVEIQQLKNSTIFVFDWQFNSKKTLLEEKTMIVEIDESQPRYLIMYITVIRHL